MSKGLRKGLIAVLLIAAAVYVGAKLYVRSQADAALSEAKYALRDLVKLSYEGYSAGLDGSLTLSDLTIRPSEGQGELFVRRLTLKAESLPAALGVRRHLNAGRIPSNLTLQAEDIRLNFDSPLYRRLRQATGGFLVGTPIDHLACGEVSETDAAALEAMGYSYVSANAQARLDRGRDERAALVTVRIEAEDLAEVSGEAVLRTKDDTLNLEALRTGVVGLADADLRYRDRGYFDARNYYCAAQRDSDVEAFLAAHRQAVARYLREHGAVPTEAFLDAYLRLISSPGNELQIAVSPEQPVPARDLAGMGPEQLAQVLQPAWAVNGNAVGELIARWVAPSGDALRPEAGNAETAQARYFPADPTMLDQLVGSFARIVTYDGTTHKGVIQEATGSRITMQRRFQGGDMSFGIATGDVESAEIYRRQPLPASLRPKPESEEQTETIVVSPETESAPEAPPENGAGQAADGQDATPEGGTSPKEDAESSGAMTSPDLDDLEPGTPDEPAGGENPAQPTQNGASDP